MMDHAHTILQPEKDELLQESAPRPAVFVRGTEAPQPETPASETRTKPAAEPATIIGPDGQEYVN
jgi:hypothetical protein